MTTNGRNPKLSVVEAVAGAHDLTKALKKEALREVFEGETTEFLEAEPGGTRRGPRRVSAGLLRPKSGHPDRPARIAGLEGSQRRVLHRAR